MDAAALGVTRHRWLGRSEGRASLREFSSRFPVHYAATLHELFVDGKIERSVLEKAIKDLGINAANAQLVQTSHRGSSPQKS